MPFREIRLSGLRLGDRKVVWDHVAAQGAIYDLRRDARELSPRPFQDLEASQDPLVVQLRGALDELDRRRAELPLHSDGEAGLLPPELVEELERLGYL